MDAVGALAALPCRHVFSRGWKKKMGVEAHELPVRTPLFVCMLEALSMSREYSALSILLIRTIILYQFPNLKQSWWISTVGTVYFSRTRNAVIESYHSAWQILASYIETKLQELSMASYVNFPSWDHLLWTSKHIWRVCFVSSRLRDDPWFPPRSRRQSRADKSTQTRVRKFQQDDSHSK